MKQSGITVTAYGVRLCYTRSATLTDEGTKKRDYMDFNKNPRGFRNNNPGNIRHGNDWKGETNGQDSAFETFTSVEYGIRAIFKLLDTYEKKYNAVTITEIISRFAPPHENATANYINNVLRYMQANANPDQAVYLKANNTNSKINAYGLNLEPLFVGGIIFVENGLQPLNFDFIKECKSL